MSRVPDRGGRRQAAVSDGEVPAKSSERFRGFGIRLSPSEYLHAVSTHGVALHHGQSGEDVALLRMLRGQTDGFYVDIGAFHPRVYSNTYVLHHYFGWRGINVDASSEAIRRFDEERPHDVNIHCAVGHAAKEARFYRISDPASSTLSPANLQRQLSKGNAVTGEETMPIRPLADLLQAHMPEDTAIDLLNVDVEGLDLEVLQSHDWERWRPRIVLVEDYEVGLGTETSSAIQDFMREHGFVLASHHFDTSIYADEVLSRDLKRPKAKEGKPAGRTPSRKPSAKTLARSKALVGDHPESKRLSTRLAEALENLAGEREEAARRRDQVLEAEARLARIDEAARDAEARHASMQSQVERLERDLQEVRKARKSLSDRLQRSQAELKTLKDRWKEANRDRKRFKQSYTALVHSRSWRFTAPARKLGRVIRDVLPIDLGRAAPRPAHASEAAPLPVTAKAEPETRAPSGPPPTKYVLEKTKFNLYNLGFEERPVEDLRKLLDAPDAGLMRAAARELARWHANRRTRADARECLDILRMGVRSQAGPATRRQAAILAAESHELLGDVGAAKGVLLEALSGRTEVEDRANLLLALSNLESTEAERIRRINEALALYALSGVRIETGQGDRRAPLDRLLPLLGSVRTPAPHAEPKVSVVMPAYNAEATIGTALACLLRQSWRNLEILVVDDCSTDGTRAVVETIAAEDSRVRLLRTEVNGGAYVARNTALQAATGDFVTTHDTDDWSHPEKIATQARHLVENASVIGNTSQLARVGSDLRFSRGQNPGQIVLQFTSSFMFRRKPVLEAIGYWDSVRFGADSEYLRRIHQVFGEMSVVDLKTGPLSFYRKSSSSLTGNEAFGHPGYYMGARKEYFESQTHFHETTDSLYFPFPQGERPFPVPEPMLPDRRPKTAPRRHFDVIIASEFRMLGGSTLSCIEEIKAQRQLGLRTGLVQMCRYDLSHKRGVLPSVRAEIDGDQVQMIVFGEKVSCDLLIIRYPPVLQDLQRYIPDIEARDVRVIVNQTPLSDYGPSGVLRYEIGRCHENLQHYFGGPGTWHPIGPLVRDALLHHHAKDVRGIRLSEEDWTNIIDVSEWRRSGRPPPHPRVRVGRHGRDDPRKWPSDPRALAQIYPEDPGYEIHVLGGASAPAEVLGGLPGNWRVNEFGAVPPREFLAELDVFVYFTHPDLVESFGRVILEAMAAGVPVVVPDAYRKLYGDAAIYAEPAGVRPAVEALMGDPDGYRAQVDRALGYVEERFGHSAHAARLNAIVTRR